MLEEGGRLGPMVITIVAVVLGVVLAVYALWWLIFRVGKE